MRTLIFFLMVFGLFTCKKEEVQLSANTDEIFWVRNDGADMPVWVKGNTASKVFIFFVHGGPADCAYRYTGVQTAGLRARYAVAFWSERNAGASAGNVNYNQLSLLQMVEDLEKAIQVLKYRYGQDIRVFLYGHSFGGLLTAAYLSTGDNQLQCRGWIEVDGAHNYPLTNTLSRQMLIDTGQAEILAGRHLEPWQEIVQYCLDHEANANLEASYQINQYAQDAEDYVLAGHQTQLPKWFTPASPVALGINLYKLYFTPAGKPFLQSLELADYSEDLEKVTIPTLLLWGQYDFVVPTGVGEDAFQHLGSTYKRLQIFPRSGHHPMNDENAAFTAAIVEFVEEFR